MTGTICAAPGGLSTLSGGTRTAVKTVRPWQVQMTLPENCPLCSQEQLDEHFPWNGWKTFANRNTPWPYHRLLIPTECWPLEKLWSLGGPEILATMLRLAIGDVVRTRADLYPIWIYTHIGYGAGQNFPHHHWHINVPPTAPRRFEADGFIPLWESLNFRTRLCGVRAGQTEIDFCPPSDNLFIEDPLHQLDALGLLDEFVGEAHRLIQCFNEKFNCPDYCLLFAFNGGNEWHARYTPILNNWGGSEFAALDYGTPFVLPWPHEATRDFLLAS